MHFSFSLRGITERLWRLFLFSTGFVGLFTGCAESLSPLDPNAPDFSFVVIGCNRIDKADTTGSVSTANIEQLNRTFAEVAALSPRPAFLFFAGDMVFGYTADTVRLAQQLNAWKALYQASPLPASGIELVPIPGNHEVQDASKVTYAAGERTWIRIMSSMLAHAGNGPAAGSADNLKTDQSKLTYSFDYRGAHFVLLNTDPMGYDWRVPAKWVAADVAAARTAGAKHVFAIGHKPAYAYPTTPTDGLSLYVPERDAFWNALLSGQAEAMLSAHDHVYWRTRPAVGKTWQIIAGNGGSILEPTIDASITPAGKYFGFTVVTVTKGGTVYAKSYGRDVPPTGYMASSSAYPTTVRDSVDITWR